MTIFIHIQPGDGKGGPVAAIWQPWINCTDRKEVEALAAHRHLRDRGGVGEAEGNYSFTVYSYLDTDPKHPNGRPMVANTTTFWARKERAA